MVQGKYGSSEFYFYSQDDPLPLATCDLCPLSLRPLRLWNCQLLLVILLLPAEACLCSWWVVTPLKMASISSCLSTNWQPAPGYPELRVGHPPQVGLGTGGHSTFDLPVIQGFV